MPSSHAIFSVLHNFCCWPNCNEHTSPGYGGTDTTRRLDWLTDWLAGWLAGWLTARQLDGRQKRTPKGTSASTNTQLLRQSLRGCQLPTATYSHPKNDAYNCEFELQLQHKQQQQQQWPWPWQWHELRWWSYPFILAFAYSDQRASSVIAAGRKRPTRRWHMTWKNEKEAPLAPSYAPRWRWLTQSVSNWNKWSNVWLWDKPE